MNKVWIYTIATALSDEQLAAIQALGETFTASWTAHEKALSARFEIFKKRLIVVRVNEDHHSASGCSIDKLLHFIKDLEKKFNVSLLDRLLVAYESGSEISVVKSAQIPALLEKGEIDKSTRVYDTAVSTESELKTWLKPLQETWLKKYLQKV